MTRPPIVPERGVPLTAETVGLLQQGDWLRFDDGNIHAFKKVAPFKDGQHVLMCEGRVHTYDRFTFLGRPGADGWIAHDGGENPAPGLRVDARTRCGNAFDGEDADSFAWSRGAPFNGGDIIAWRPHVAAAPAREPEGGAVECGWCDGRKTVQTASTDVTVRCAHCRGTGVEAALTHKEAPAATGADAIKAACVAWHQANGENPFNVLYRGSWCGNEPHQTGPERWTFTIPAMRRAVEEYLRAQPQAREEAQPVAWFRRSRQNPEAWHQIDARDVATHRNRGDEVSSIPPTQPLAEGADAEKLRVAIEAIQTLTNQSGSIPKGEIRSILAALQQDALSAAPGEAGE